METMATKRCPRCKQELPVTEFGQNQSKKDGLQSYCRECYRAYNRERRKKNAARQPDEIPTPSEKRCPGCERELSANEFSKDQGSKDGLQGYCRECYRAYKREYAKKNAARNPDEIPIPPEKRCPGCGVTRPVSEWSRSNIRPDGLQRSEERRVGKESGSR